MCVYGPDKYGDLREDVVDEEVALQCENCQCRLTQIECLIGPDKNGKFYRSDTSWEYAQECEKEKCLCSIHTDFIREATHRVKNSMLNIQKIREYIAVQEKRAIELTKNAWDLEIEAQ